ncbi:peptide chain release factor N(5)-glutamine methyltransferase [Mycoplasmopsis cricetuli]|uniref:peptide chain release factor N(5)-glutamine methyltransferase n=1 Tax=Mycoplasmopsis cricetuli TaxID=171283 RepID=UPI0004707923|nr:peptide chain release factor N(5)-glutamine methyltransferase [Mycoplasmopsis cricetuli]
MPTKEDLLLEKRRYHLPQKISINELKLLKQGMPVQKIIGYVDLANVRIDVNYNVLIPRYETEELIFLVNTYLSKNQKSFKLLDLCCGSGIIAIALKKMNLNLDVTASDIDLEAIKATTYNAKLNNINIKIKQSDLFKNINSKFDIIVSNPPYLGKNEILSDSILKFEPHHALFANNNGFEFYEKILLQASNYLTENGVIFFEINPLHIEKWKKLQKKINIQIIKDINSKDRFAVVKFLSKAKSL